MTWKLKSAATILISCATVVAAAQSLIDAENLLFAPPKDFKIGYQSNHDNRMMTEWVPTAETVQDWTQMLTVQIFRGATVDAAAFLNHCQRSLHRTDQWLRRLDAATAVPQESGHWQTRDHCVPCDQRQRRAVRGSTRLASGSVGTRCRRRHACTCEGDRVRHASRGSSVPVV